MFTVAQIKAAHAKVKSGADFPNYIREIKELGVTGYKTFVADGHSAYYGKDNFITVSQPIYDALAIANTCNKEQFMHYLKIHQQGETDYLDFCRHCAATGITYWTVSLELFTCTYYDKADNEILVEIIPH